MCHVFLLIKNPSKKSFFYPRARKNPYLLALANPHARITLGTRRLGFLVTSSEWNVKNPPFWLVHLYHMTSILDSDWSALYYYSRDQSGQSQAGRWAHVARLGSITQNTGFSHVKLYGYHRTAWNARSKTICDQDANGQTWSCNTIIVEDKSSFDIFELW